jgi:hypothetical protein
MSRHLFSGGVNDLLVARLAEHAETLPIAHACAWCGKPASPADALLIAMQAAVSHGICERCEQAFREGAA